MSHFEIYQDDRGEYRWRFRAENGEILADSGEGYVALGDCERGIDLLKKDAPSAPVDRDLARP